MGQAAFNALYVFEQLIDAGLDDAQARSIAGAFEKQSETQKAELQKQAEAFGKQVEAQKAELQRQAERHSQELKEFARELEARQEKEVATKGNLRETELRLQKEIEIVRKEIEVNRKEIEVNRKEIGKVRYDLLRWQLGIGIALVLIIAKGFGWLGF